MLQPESASLRGAVTRASESLSALAEGWKSSNARRAQHAQQHLDLQRDAANDLKRMAEEQMTSYHENIDQCLDLLERLEKAEEIAVKIKNLRGTVDRIAEQLG